MVDLGLEGKVVVITGASQGIGRALAGSYATEGATLVLVGRTEPVETLRLIEGKCQVTVERADVTLEAQVQRAVLNTLDRYGKVDILINNAGALHEGYLAELDEALWDMILATNLKSVWLFSKAVAPSMMRSRSGCIINASSFAAIIPSAGHGAYAAAKAGVVSLTKTLAGELGPYGIKVFAYVPGVIDTNLTKHLIAKNREGIVKTIASGRIGTPEDIADTIVMLSSPRAGYLNGSIIEISGGKFAVQNIEKAQTLAASK